ncbi:MAG: hypothetical protein QXG39_02675 [Candidatus Aenigmatarchaeota archaeon]
MVYVLGVSSGYFSVAGPEERPQLVGLFKKAQSTITKGVNFVQLDLESIAEFEEPDLEKKMESEIRDKLKINYGIHSETRAAGVEAAELDSAIKMEYERAHNRLLEILEKSKKIKAKYVLVHSSESEPFRLLERVPQSSDLVDPFGNPLRDFLQKNTWLLNWLFSGTKEDRKKDIVNTVLELWDEKKMQISMEDLEKAFKQKGIRPQNFFWLEFLHGRTLEEILVERVTDRVQYIMASRGATLEKLSEEEKVLLVSNLRMLLEILLQDLEKEVISQVQSRDLRYGPERWAYYFVAKWMEDMKHVLWEKIVWASIKFFAARDGKNVEKWLEERKIDPEKLSIEEDNFRSSYEIWVPAVASLYIYGHFFPERKEYKDPKEYLGEMIFTLETPMGGRGIEEWLRLANPYQYYFLVEEMNKRAGREIFAVAMDFEHMLSLRIDPEKVIELLPPDGGKYVRVVHAGWPSTLAPAHLPIEIGSDQQKYLYAMYYKLRQKGFGKGEKEYYIIFERGGPETFQQSVTALKLIIEHLEKDIPPEKLMEYPSFFGIDLNQTASMERQLTIIKEHALDPLRGLITVPEETHTFLGRAAVEKGKAEEWRRERYR